MAHQKTPWRVAGGMSGAAGYLSSEDGYVVLCTPFVENAHRDKNGGANPEALANANHIAKCVNSHDALLAALQGMLEWARRVKERNPGMEIVNAHNAIDKATREG